MKLINENAFKFDSVKYGAYMALFLSVLYAILQEVFNAQVLQEPYQSIVSAVLVVLAVIVGKKKYQPELHQIQSFAAVPNANDNLTNLFSSFRKLAGGSLSQVQVDQINQLVAGFQKIAKTVSTAGIALICSFEGLKLKAYDDGVGVWTIGFGTTIYPNGIKVRKGDTCTEAQAKAYMAHDLKKFESAV